jgi:hypothetical protein
MADLASFLIIDVKYLKIKLMNQINLVRNRICAQGWYMPLYWGNFSPENQGFEIGLFSPF